MAREQREKSKRVVGYLDAALYPEWQEIVEHRGGESAALGWVIYEEILRKRGAETKDDMLHALLADQEQLKRKVDLLLMLVWSLLAKGKVEFTAEDVRKLRELLAEFQL